MNNSLMADNVMPLILPMKRYCSEYFKCSFDNECVADTNIVLTHTS